MCVLLFDSRVYVSCAPRRGCWRHAAHQHMLLWWPLAVLLLVLWRQQRLCCAVLASTAGLNSVATWQEVLLVGGACCTVACRLQACMLS